MAEYGCIYCPGNYSTNGEKMKAIYHFNSL